MGKINSRAKGAAGERELANYLREQGWKKARRTQQYAGNIWCTSTCCTHFIG
jgi:hypothetical protein